MAEDGFFYKILLWRERRIKEKNFILIVSFLVGICTAASAIILKQLIHFIQQLLTGGNHAGATAPLLSIHRFAILIMLLLGATWLRRGLGSNGRHAEDRQPPKTIRKTVVANNDHFDLALAA